MITSLEDLKEPVLASLEKIHRLLKDKEDLRKTSGKIEKIIDDLQEPPVVMIFGEFNAGKSTFINALLGEKILTSDVIPATAVVTKLKYGSRRELVAHFKDGSKKVMQSSQLEQLSSERKEQQKLRESLYYLELKVNHPLLKTMSLVDSPGLNSGHDHHTAATEMFMDMADEAFWVFWYKNVGLSSEMESIQQLISKGIKPVGIVNGIDQLDDETDNLDQYLEYIKTRRLQGVLDKVIGLSALEALEGQVTGDRDLLELSNWGELQSVLGQTKGRDDVKKAKLLGRITEAFGEIAKVLTANLKKYQSAGIERSVVEIVKIAKDLRKLDKEQANLTIWMEQLSVANSLFNGKGKIVNLDQMDREMEHFASVYTEIKGTDSVIKNVMGKWNSLRSAIISQKELAGQYTGEFADVSSMKEELTDHWNHVKQSRFFKGKKMSAMQEKTQEYERQLGDLREMKLKVEKGKMDLEKLNSSFLQSLQHRVRDLRNDQAENINRYLKKRNHLYLGMKAATKDVRYEHVYQLCALTDFLEDVLDIADEIGEGAGWFVLRRDDYLSSGTSIDFSRFEQAYAYVKTINADSNIALAEKRLTTFAFLGNPLFGKTAEPENLPFDLVKEHKAHRRSHNEKLFVGALLLIPLIGAIVDAQEPDVQGVYEEYNENDFEENAEAEEMLAVEEPIEENTGWQQIEDGQIEELIGSLQEMVLSNGPSGLDSERFGSETELESYREYVSGAGDGKSLENLDYDLISVDRSDPDTLVAVIQENQTFSNAFTKTVYEVEATYSMNLDEYGQLSIVSFSYEIVDTTEESLIKVTQSDLESFFSYYLEDAEMEYNTNADSTSKYLSMDASIAPHSFADGLEGYILSFVTADIVSFEKVTENQYKVNTSEEFILVNSQNKEEISVKDEREYTVGLSEGSLGELLIYHASQTNTTQAVVKEPAYNLLVKPEDVQSAITKFQKSYIDAYNLNDFSYVRSLYDGEGKAVIEAESRMQTLKESVETMELVTYVPHNVTPVDQDFYRVDVTRQLNYIQIDGIVRFVEFESSYLMKVTPDGEILLNDIFSSEVIQDKVIEDGEM
ncbi:dynamin family protein [Metabacillus idriensis]|uniref:dynamin family protein n=1 Tax=Metabacillus idriensis TaxID=324768 RepID=UPI003D2E8DA0